MTQIIDLRKRDTPLEAPKPPVEPVQAPEPTTEVEMADLAVMPEASDIRWSTHLSRPHDHGRILYITFGLVIAAILVAYFAHDFLFTVVLILSAIVLNLNAAKPHRRSEIAVHATGISIDDQRHHYADIKSFWVEYQPTLKELSIELKKGYAQRIRVPLEDANPLEIRRAMLSYIPEKEHELSFLDHIVRLIRI